MLARACLRDRPGLLASVRGGAGLRFLGLSSSDEPTLLPFQLVSSSAALGTFAVCFF